MIDMAHRELDVGDYVVYATTSGRSATLKFGIILEMWPGQIKCRSVRPYRDLITGAMFKLQKDTIVSSYWHLLWVQKESLPIEVQRLLG